MAFSSYFFALSLLTVSAYGGPAQLSPTFYATTCPNLESIVRRVMTLAVNMEPRMGGSILRLFFHDCFVNVVLKVREFDAIFIMGSNFGAAKGFKGCDASILLDDVGSFVGEKNAPPNRGSMRGYEVIDAIKTHVEASCNGTVSCADILALAARDGVYLLRGQSWTVPLGRRDAKTASQEAANTQIPGPWASLSTLIAMFAAKGLSARDMTVLSGSHTIGQAHCVTFHTRIYNDTNIDPTFAAMRQANCSTTRGEANLVPLDLRSPTKFDNKYYKNLIAGRGLLHSDQELFNNGSQDALVRTYSRNNAQFLSDYAAAMVRMGNISPLTGRNGEIRRNCRRVN